MMSILGLILSLIILLNLPVFPMRRFRQLKKCAQNNCEPPERRKSRTNSGVKFGRFGRVCTFAGQLVSCRLVCFENINDTCGCQPVNKASIVGPSRSWSKPWSCCRQTRMFLWRESFDQMVSSSKSCLHHSLFSSVIHYSTSRSCTRPFGYVRVAWNVAQNVQIHMIILPRLLSRSNYCAHFDRLVFQNSVFVRQKRF